MVRPWDKQPSTKLQEPLLPLSFFWFIFLHLLHFPAGLYPLLPPPLFSDCLAPFSLLFRSLLSRPTPSGKVVKPYFVQPNSCCRPSFDFFAYNLETARTMGESWFQRELTGRRLVFNIIFYGGQLGAFAYGWNAQLSNPKLATLNLLKFSVWSSRGAGLCLGIDGALLLLPGTAIHLRNLPRNRSLPASPCA